VGQTLAAFGPRHSAAAIPSPFLAKKDDNEIRRTKLGILVPANSTYTDAKKKITIYRLKASRMHFAEIQLQMATNKLAC